MSEMKTVRCVTSEAQRALMELSLRQTVEVRIRGNIWVVGLIVGALQFFNRFASMGYEVEYQSHSGYRRDTFRTEDIRPVSNNKINEQK